MDARASLLLDGLELGMEVNSGQAIRGSVEMEELVADS